MTYSTEIKRILIEQSNAILHTLNALDEKQINPIIKSLMKCSGKIIFTGIGKSGHIAKKSSATFSSLGMPSYFIHSTEALHGDSGSIQKNDILFTISKSGETEEVINLLKKINRRNIQSISLTHSKDSTINKNSSLNLNLNIQKESDHLNIAPTSSTTTALAICDAIAITCSKEKNFTKNMFAKYHPLGSLGKLLSKVEDHIISENQNSFVLSGETMKNTIIEMCEKRLGATCVVNKKNEILGIITDGDLKRILINNIPNLNDMAVDNFMTKNPITIKEGTLFKDALSIMKERSSQISILPIIDKKNKLKGMIRIHDIL